MKIKGKKIEGRNKEIIPIPRPDGPIFFIAEAVLDYKPFDKMVKEPKAPVRKRANGEMVIDASDENYQVLMAVYNRKKMAWLILESLKSTPDLEWETVDLNNSDTWMNWEKELQQSEFSQFEINRILSGVFTANCLNEALVQAARDSFQHGTQEKAADTSGQNTEQATTQSGEPAVA